jgi:hypothetical protein
MNIKRHDYKLKNQFRDDDSRFLLICGLKFSIIFAIVMGFIFYVTWIILSINNVYFVSNGFSLDSGFSVVFFDRVLQIVYAKIPYLFSVVIFLFFAGIYCGKILLRPFELIGSYAISKTEGLDASYNPDTFSDYKLLTRFSEFFFRYLDECLQNKKLLPNTIPASFTKIHGPQFEKVFFFHFMLFIGIVTLVTASFTIYMTTSIQAQLVDLSISIIPNGSTKIAYFLNNQVEVLHSVIYFGVLLMSCSYLLLSFHLYNKVSGAVFGFFATMRSFMRGNLQARVHLIGYKQIRPHGRALNKYLDMV